MSRNHSILRGQFGLRFRLSRAKRILYMRAIQEGRGRMADADQQHTHAAVSQLFREHNRMLVRYLTVCL
jgi:hypothetical protein